MAAVTIFQRNAVPSPPMVKNLRPGVTEVGRIKIGQKGAVRETKNGVKFQMPVKLDHFVVTTMHRGQDGNFIRDDEIHAIHGDQPRKLPVRLLFNDPGLNFQTQYVAYWGKHRWCTGDGESAQRLQKDGGYRDVECPCPNLEQGFQGVDGKGNGKCKINGVLSVIIDDAAMVGGVWRFRTTSINTCESIARSLDMLYRLSSGHIAGIPLDLTVSPKEAHQPDGTPTTIYVVGLTFRGTVQELRTHAEQHAIEDARYAHRMAQLDEQARLSLAGPVVPDEEAREVIEEFYPEIAANGAAESKSRKKVSPPKQQAPADASPAGGMIEVVDANGEIFLKPPVEAEAFLREQIPLLAADFIDEWRQMNADSLGEPLLGLLAEHERAEQAKSTKGRERAVPHDSTEAAERAVHDGRTETDERASAAEGNVVSEPAAKQESTAVAERANAIESADQRERAEAKESTVLTERATPAESTVGAEPQKPEPTKAAAAEPARAEPAKPDEEVIVLWPGEQDPARMKWASVPPAYMRRKRSGSSGWAEDFKRLNPDLYERLPASNR